MAAIGVLGTVEELTNQTVCSVAAAAGAGIGTYQKSRLSPRLLAA
jgi:hypothetical protein